jgi:hypothetical protein
MIRLDEQFDALDPGCMNEAVTSLPCAEGHKLS